MRDDIKSLGTWGRGFTTGRLSSYEKSCVAGSVHPTNAKGDLQSEGLQCQTTDSEFRLVRIVFGGIKHGVLEPFNAWRRHAPAPTGRAHARQPEPRGFTEKDDCQWQGVST